MTGTGTPPDIDEFEFTLLGPGYGESIVLHVGGGAWVLVDSCLDEKGTPRSLRYLENMDIDPAESVELIVATHWHDDHIRGMTQMVEVCDKATFCCSSVLRDKEFLAVIGALEYRHLSVAGSGLREIFNVFSRLSQVASRLKLALIDCLIFGNYIQ
ncbi:MAG: MBL fold metallo-hydrolase [Nitrospinae bacterium]|nr:MBL fold metallo-hydrolase [Nitrospinota bacterium]